MSIRSGKSRKNLLFFLLAFAVVVLIMFVANYRSNLVLKLRPPEGGVRKLFTSAGKLIAVSSDNEVYVWDWKNLSAEPQKGSVKAQDVTWMEPGWLVWTPVAEADTLIVSDLKGQKEYKRMSLGWGWRCKILRTSRNGKFTAIGLVEKNSTNLPGRIRVEMLDSRFEKVTTAVTIAGKSDDFALGNVAVSEDGAFVAVVGSNNGGWVAVADVKRKKILWEKVPEGTTKIDEVTFSPDGKMIYTGGFGKTVYGFGVATGRIVHRWIAGQSKKEPQEIKRRRSVTAIDVSSDSRLVITMGVAMRAYTWDAITGKLVSDRDNGGWTVVDLAFSPDSFRVAFVAIQARAKVLIWQMSAAP